MKVGSADKIDIEQTNRAPGSTLGGEVVDVGNSDVVDKGEVLGGTAAADYQIVALVVVHADTGHGLEQAAYILGRVGGTTDLLVAEVDCADRLFFGAEKYPASTTVSPMSRIRWVSWISTLVSLPGRTITSARLRLS